MKVSKSDKAEALAVVKKALAGMPKPGKWAQGRRTVYTCVKHVSASGMQRQIKVFVPQADGELYDITYRVSQLLGWSLGKHGGVKVDGCGMDMCFHLFDCVMSALGTGSRDWQSMYRLESI